MLHAALCSALLIATLYCSGCKSCNLTEKVLDDSNGLVHRCQSTSGTYEWQFGAACWIRPPENDSGAIVELEFGQKYIDNKGREVAQCRRGRYDTVLVYLACLVAFNNSKNNVSREIRWPGEVWTGNDGLQYTCTNASSISSSEFKQGSRVILYGCNSTLRGGIIEPESRELTPEGLVKTCILDARYPESTRYLMEATGCWLRHQTAPENYYLLEFGQEYFINKNNRKESFATCRKRYSGEALVYYQCIENVTTNYIFRAPGSVWTGSDGVERECLPADPSDLVSARIIIRACNDSVSLVSPGSETRMDDGSVWRCGFNRYRGEYGWFEAVGCWPKAPHWLKIANFGNNLYVGDEICLNNQTCLGKCVKRRYFEEVALLSTVCFENVGKSVKYRLPYENWTDDGGVDRMCIPISESKFGVGAQTIIRGCHSKRGNSTELPGALFLDSNFLVYECKYNPYQREYNFQEIVGCWMHDSSGKRIIIDHDQAYKLNQNQTVATCRKKRYVNRVYFTVEVCFKDNTTSMVNWSISSIAFAKEKMSVVSKIYECDPAATYLDGVDAKWIVYGCPLENSIASPGSTKQSEDGIIWQCAHNDRQGSGAAYSWVKPVGCWFKDHLGQNIVISEFNVVYKHPSIGNATAECEHRRYSEPNLKMFVCFSQENGHYYLEGNRWTEPHTGLTKECVSTSRYSSDGVKIINAGCWLQASKGSSSSVGLSTLLSSNGSVASATDNRILRCEFNERSRHYEWSTSVGCWFKDDSGALKQLASGQEYWSNGMLIYKCLQTRSGAVFVNASCQHNGTWHAGMSAWTDENFRYKCQPASGTNSATVIKTHCISDEGTLFAESQKIKGIQYVCQRICGFLVFIREPTPEHYRLLFRFIRNCHTINMNIINSIG